MRRLPSWLRRFSISRAASALAVGAPLRRWVGRLPVWWWTLHHADGLGGAALLLALALLPPLPSPSARWRRGLAAALGLAAAVRLARALLAP